MFLTLPTPKLLVLSSALVHILNFGACEQYQNTNRNMTNSKSYLDYVDRALPHFDYNHITIG